MAEKLTRWDTTDYPHSWTEVRLYLQRVHRTRQINNALRGRLSGNSVPSFDSAIRAARGVSRCSQ